MTQRPKKCQKNGNMLVLDPKSFECARSATKVLASIFWNKDGVILTDYMKQGKSITRDCCYSFLIKLRTKIVKLCRTKLSKGALFLQDNLPAFCHVKI
jgi:hypothetical protein